MLHAWLDELATRTEVVQRSLEELARAKQHLRRALDIRRLPAARHPDQRCGAAS